MTDCDGYRCYFEDVEELEDPIYVTEEQQTKVNGYAVNTQEVDSLAFCSPMCLAHYLTDAGREVEGPEDDFRELSETDLFVLREGNLEWLIDAYRTLRDEQADAGERA